jgi:ATP-dependent helicase/nuclease subunit A
MMELDANALRRASPRAHGDAATRRIAVDELTDNVFVEAGAGTGKTSLLVARLCALVVDSEVPLSAVAAITFTEKAAAELRDRFRHELAKQGRADLAAQIDDATLTTIHGFARAVLASHALAAELPPGFTVLDDLEAAVGFDRRFNHLMASLLSLDGPHRDAVRMVLVLGAGRRELANLLLRLQEQRDRLVAIDWPLPPPMPSTTRVIEAIEAVVPMRAACLDAEDKLAVHLDGLASLVQELRDLADDAVEQLRVLSDCQLTFPHGRKAAWIGAYTKDDVTSALRVAEDARQQLKSAAGHHVVATLVPPLVEFLDISARQRRLAGTLEFHDLLVEAVRLLSTDQRVRREVSNRWPHVLVDEFQDTDPLQLELITLVAAVDDDPASMAWHERTLGAGALFAVGDPKQSIYRFRGADMRLYRDAAQSLAGVNGVLDRNFRTVPGVLAWVNAVMAELFGSGREEQAEFRSLRPHRRGSGAGVVEVLGAEPCAGFAADVRAVEARELAETVVRMRASQMVIEPKGQPHRPVRYRDMAVLLPARTSLPALEAALDEANVPYRVESRSLVYATAEVRTIAMVMRAVDDPADEIAVVGALRSAAFACSDRDLIDWRRAGGRWSPFGAAPDGLDVGHPVAVALAMLVDFHRQRWWLSLDELVHAVIDHCRLREAALAHGRPRDRWRRLQLVVDQAVRYERAGGRQLRGFVDWLDRQRDLGAADAETVVADLDDDAVRISTVHAAKGLEYPVVILAGLGSPDRIIAPPLLWDEGGCPLVRLGRKDFGFQHPGYEEAWGRHRSFEAAEDERLLYVAATRARDRLVVCLHRGIRGTSAAHRLHSLMSAIPELWTIHQSELPFAADPPVLAVAAGTPPVVITDWHAAHARAVAQWRAPVMSATSIAATAVDSTPDASNDDAAQHDEAVQHDERPPWRRGRAGTSIGRAVHAVLQSIDLATGAGLDTAATVQSGAEGISSMRDEVASLVRHVLAAPIVVEAAGSRHWREVFVAAEIDGVLVEGFVDLLVERPDGTLVVVDFKTDSARSEADIDAAMVRYRLQGAAYGEAVEAVLTRVVSEVVFVFARAGATAAQRSVDDLDGARRAVRQTLSSGAAR